MQAKMKETENNSLEGFLVSLTGKLSILNSYEEEKQLRRGIPTIDWPPCCHQTNPSVKWNCCLHNQVILHFQSCATLRVNLNQLSDHVMIMASRDLQEYIILSEMK